MSEENTVVDARSRFRGGAESPEQRKQARADGAAALEALKACELSGDDREQIARRIGFRIHGWSRKDRGSLANRSGFESKELYRLVLRVGEELTDKYRLRPAGERYAALIETLAGLLRPPTNVADLADRMTRGTSVHPSDRGTSSDAGVLLNLLYNLVDGIDEEFHLIEKFRAISRRKVASPERDPWALWPAWLSEDDWKERDRLGEDPASRMEPWEERLQSSFWIARTEEEKEAAIERLKSPGFLSGREPATEEEIEQELCDPTFGFKNWNWDQVIGYLPHFFLGHQKEFHWDKDFWCRPSNMDTDGREEKLWEVKLEDDVFDVMGRQATISTEWDDDNRLLFNGDPSDVFRRRICKFQIINNVANFPENWDENLEDEDIHPHDPPAFFWLCLYPNADATGVVPVLLSTGWEYGESNTIELLDERMLSHIDHYPVLGGETLGARLRRALLVANERQEPALKAEWRHTAHFVERHPLWRKHQEYEATARHIKKWREQVLKGGPVRSDRQEEKS